VEELWISNLPKDKKKATDYKVDQKDFKIFESKINEFLSKDGMPFAKGRRVTQEY
jgi:hypothetical protein